MLIKKINRCLICFISFLVICSSSQGGQQQEVLIKFKPVQGASYYEIKMLSEQEDTGPKIIQVEKTLFKQNISAEYHSFQIRAVFSEEVKTKWSLVYKLNRLKRPKRKVDHTKFKLVYNQRYKTFLKVSSKYYHRNNILWIGSETKIEFIFAMPYYSNKKEIFYRFRKRFRKKTDKVPDFTPFEKPIKLKKIFQNTNELYFVEFYSINNETTIKETVQDILLFVDTSPPKIRFWETDVDLIWELNDQSLPIQVSLYINNVLFLKKDQDHKLVIPKNEINYNIDSINLVASDFLGNQMKWINK